MSSIPYNCLWVKIWYSVDACSDFANSPEVIRHQPDTSRWWDGTSALFFFRSHPVIYSLIERLTEEYPDAAVELVYVSSLLSRCAYCTTQKEETSFYSDCDEGFKENVTYFMEDEPSMSYTALVLKEALDTDSL